MRMISTGVAAVMFAGAAQAQQFTSAAEIAPILEATRANWIAVREYEGRDLVYFTQVLSWRCGLSEIRYGLNGAAAETVLPMEPCYENEAQPNALKFDQGVEVYLAEPLKSVQSVDVVLKLDDGSEARASFDRSDVLMP
jgi:hypothetical protein